MRSIVIAQLALGLLAPTLAAQNAARDAFRAVIDRAQPADAAWQREADAALAALRRTPGSESAAAAAREQLAATYLDAAGRLIDEKRFTAAALLLDKAEQLTPKSAALQTRRTQWTQASERNKAERTAEELAARVDAAKQRFGNEVRAGRLDRARSTLAELQKIAAKDDVFVVRDAPTMLTDAASRRIDALLSSPETIDRAALSSAAEMYRTAAPESYRSRSAAWLATIKRRLADLASEPAAHNAYLATVQAALADVPGLKSLRPVEPKPVAPTPTQSAQVAENPPAPTPSSTTSTSTPSGAGSTAVAPAAQPPAAAAPAAEPDLLGKWCGERVSLEFAANEYSFDLGGGRTIRYPVSGYQRAGSVITMSWTDKSLGPMVTEFGEFSADGQSMVHLRGKTEASAQWQTYNRRFRRCK